MSAAMEPPAGLPLDSTLVGDLESTVEGNETTVPPATMPGDGVRRPARPLERGDVVGRYLVLGLVGSGGMGVVYAAYDPELDRKVALKLLHHADDGRRMTTLAREAQAMAKLSHPNVVTVHDVGQHEGRVFVAMEYVEGGTLRQWIEAEPRAWKDVVRTFIQAGRGLEAAHAKGLVHRDFKPDNVMLTEDHERVCVMDFGLVASTPMTTAPPQDSVMASRESLLEHQTDHMIAGTPAYMSPEQHLAQAVDARSDQFAFCAALYEGLYGQRPFAGENVAALVFAVTQGDVQPAPPGSAVPTWLRRAVVRGIDPNPDRRWPNMSSLLAELEIDRDRRRRRIIGGFALAGLLAAIPTAAWVKDRHAHAQCRDRDVHLAGAWDDAIRASLRDAIAGTAVPDAPTVADSVASRLDGYADRWMAEHVAVCDAGPTAELAAERTHCLHQRKVELQATARVLATEPDRLAVARAYDSIDDLVGPERCHDSRFVRASTQVAAEPRSEEVYAAIAQARAQRLAEKYDAAFEHADAAVTAAHAIGIPLLIGLAKAERARVAWRRDQTDAGIVDATEAYADVLAAGDQETAAIMARTLVGMLGQDRGRPSEALVWAVSARALLAPDDAEGRARLFATLGGVHKRSGDFEDARVQLDLALAELADVPGDATLRREIEGSYGDLLRELGDYEAATEMLERVVASSEAEGGIDSIYGAHWRYNLALAYSDRGQLDRALEVATSAADTYERWLGPEAPDVAYSKQQLGTIHARRGDPDLARKYFAETLAILERHGDEELLGIADVLINLAIMDNKQKRHDSAIERARRAVALLEPTYGAEHPHVTNGLSTLGIAYARSGDTAAAEPVLERVIELRTRKHGPDHASVGDAYHNLGMLSTTKGDDEAAIRHFQRAAEVRAKARGNEQTVAESLTSLAFACARARRFDEAEASIDRALGIFAELGVAPADRAARRIAVADLLWKIPEKRAAVRAAVQRFRDGIAAEPDASDAIAKLDAWLAEH